MRNDVADSPNTSDSEMHSESLPVPLSPATAIERGARDSR